MNSKLIITESPRKGDRLSTLWPSGRPRAMPTNGHLFVPPPSLTPLGVGTDWADVRVPRHPDWIQALSAAIDDAQEIIIATDPDAEGEVIAQDVGSLVARVDPGKKASRLRLTSLSQSAVLDAIDNMERLDVEPMALFWPAAQPGHVRRILDRICAGVFGTPSKPAGRVLSGFLHCAARVEPPEPEPLKNTAPGPGNLADLLLADELRDMSVEEIYGEAQYLYERGALSYPRTISRTAPEDFELASGANDAHPALHATVPRQEAERIRGYAQGEPPGLPPYMRVLVAVERRYTGGVRRPQTDSDPDTRAILRLLSDAGLGRPSTWASFSSTQARRGLYAAGTGLTDDGKRFLDWQPEWLDEGFSARLEAALSSNRPAAAQVQDIVTTLPRDARRRVYEFLEENPRASIADSSAQARSRAPLRTASGHAAGRSVTS